MFARVVISHQRERSDLPRPMARLATALDDPRDLGGIGDGADLDGLLAIAGVEPGGELGGGGPHPRRAGQRRHLGVHPVQKAAGDPRRRDLHVAIGDDGVEGVLEVGALGLVLALALGVLVVDRPAVADAGEAVEDQGLAGALGQHGVAHLVLDVLQDREVDAGLLRVLGDLLRRLVGVGVEAEEDDALPLEGVVQLDEPRDVQVPDGAIGAEEHEHDRLLADETVERDRPIGRDVVESEVGDALHDAPVDGQLGLRVAGTGQNNAERRGQGDGPAPDDGQEQPRTRPADDSIEHDDSLG